MRISKAAKLAPRQRLVPPPNGSHDSVSGAFTAEESLGAKHRRLRMAVRAFVDCGDRRSDLDPGIDQIAAELERPIGDEPADAGDHRAQAQRLLDYRVEVVLLAGGECLLEAVEDARIAKHQFERPREARSRSSRGRRPGASRARRAARRPSSRGRRHRAKQRASSRGRPGAGRGPHGRGGRRSRHGSGRRRHGCDARSGARATPAAFPRTPRLSSERRRSSSIPSTARMITSRVSASIEGASANVFPTGQRVDRRVGRGEDRVLVGLHALAVKAGRAAGGAVEVLVPVEQEQRTAPMQRLGGGVGGARTGPIGRSPEQLADQRRIEDHYEGRVRRAFAA